MKDLEPVVYIVDDEYLVQDYLTKLLANEPLHVLTLDSVEELLRETVTDGPGCLVLDVFLPGLSGLDAQRVLMDAFRHLPIVFMSGHGSIPMTVQAIKRGATDFLPKPFGREEFRAAVYRAIDLSRRLCAERDENREILQRLSELTEREAEVLYRVAEGKLNKQIALELDIAEKTVKVHRGRAMRKIGITSVAELVRLTDKLGLPPPPSG